MSYLKRIVLMITAVSLLVSFSLTVGAEDTPDIDTSKTVILAVEAFTVDGGFIRTPVEIELTRDSTISDLLNDALGRGGINSNNGAGRRITSFAIPLSTTYKVNDEITRELVALRPGTGEPELPADSPILAAISDISDERGLTSSGWLTEGDFTRQSRWVVIIDGKALDMSKSENEPDNYNLYNAAKSRPTDNETEYEPTVVRVAFSVYGNGADLALAKERMPNTSGPEPLFREAVRDGLYREIVKYYSDFEIDSSTLEVLAKLSSSQSEINRIRNLLSEEEYDDIEGVDGDDYNDDDDDYDPIDFLEEECPECGYDPCECDDGDDITTTKPPTQTPPPSTEPADKVKDEPTSKQPTGVNLLGVIPLVAILGIVTVLAKRKK